MDTHDDDVNLNNENYSSEEDLEFLVDAGTEDVGENKATKKRKHSKCWNNFTIVGERGADDMDDIICNHCKRHFLQNLRKNDTNTLLRHSRVCKDTPGSTPGSNSYRKLDMMVFREMIAVAIIEHNLPYSFVKYKRINMAFAYANPDIEFWSRNTTMADVLKVFEKEKIKLKTTMSEIPSRVCLTIDLWRAITIESYICLTVHYVDVDWVLKTKIVSFCAFPPPHFGYEIAVKLMELLKDWGLEKKVFSLTVDNASSNDNMQGILKKQIKKDLVCNGEFFHVRCSTQILNLIVQDGLYVISGALQKIRESIKFIKGSESRERMFDNCLETLEIQFKGGLVLDVSTRWNSTYLMLSRAIMLKDALRNLAEVAKTYKSFPSDLEWHRTELICEFLRPFDEITKLISGSSYPTSNLYFNEVLTIESWLRIHEYFEDDAICSMVEVMRINFDKYWEDYSDILAITAVLDPRLKFTYLEYSFNTLDPSTANAKLAHVRRKLYKLFGCYQKSQRNTANSSNIGASKEDIPTGYNGFYAFYSQKTSGNGKSPLNSYLEEGALDIVAFKSMNVLTYWRDNSSRFKELSTMACDVLSVPITTVASESSFSIGSRVLNKYRSCLLPTNVQALICARNWLRGFEELDDVPDFEEGVQETIDDSTHE